MNLQEVLVLVGSPRGTRNTSQALGSYLLARMRDRGASGTLLFLHKHVHSEEGREALLRAAADTTLLVLAAPLYVDTLPSHVISAMELLAAELEPTVPPRGLAAIMNCGYPESLHNEPALAVCRQFAAETGFSWLGGLSLGGGGVIGGRPLDELGDFAGKVRESLTIAAAALARGVRIPQEAVELMGAPMVPPRQYVTISEQGLQNVARRAGVLGQLGARPYEESPET